MGVYLVLACRQSAVAASSGESPTEASAPATARAAGVAESGRCSSANVRGSNQGEEGSVMGW